MQTLSFDAGMKLLAAKNHQAAYDLAIAALKRNEKDPLAFFFLGMVASDHGHHDKALEFFAKASEHGPRNVRYQAFHAKAFLTLGRLAEAKTLADKAAALTIKDAFLADMIGTVYSRTGYHDLAIPLFEKAVKLNPKWVIFHFNLGASAEFLGDFKKAEAAYEKIITLDPKFYRAWFALVHLETQTEKSNRLDQLKTHFEQAAGDIEGRLMLGHSIAKTMEDLERYQESLDWLEKAKQDMRKHIKFDHGALTKMFDAVKTAELPKGAVHQDAPIFVVGMPRTGTTLLDRILSAHKDVNSVGELELFGQLIVTGANDAGQAYSEEARSLAKGAKYTVDKTPTNFLYAGQIHSALPNARIIVLRRGALDSCLSNYRQMFAMHERRYDYSFDLGDTAVYYREFDMLIAHWREALPANRFTEIRYEDIVTDQENQTRRLLEFCGLDWDEACLRFYENAAATDTASAVQVRQPLHTGSIGRWKKYGNRLDVLRAALGDITPL